jgi:hypothetical protein
VGATGEKEREIDSKPGKAEDKVTITLAKITFVNGL